jgi:pimeloyl-ACP methyl ester carboxylesterase
MIAAQQAVAQSALARKLITEDFMVPALDAGIELHVRNKRPEEMTRFAPEDVVLFVHGATTPCETGFDLRLDGLSWMEYIAARGYDTWFVNVRGFGRSTRPREMSMPAQDNPPIVRTPIAAQDVGCAVDFIRKRRAVPKINLIGHSWGTRIMSMYVIDNNDKVNKLVLYAPGWIRSSPSLTDPGGTLGAYRTVTLADVIKRRNTGLPAGVTHSDLMPPAWFDLWAEAAFAADPWGRQQNPKVMRAPTGPQADNRDYFGVGKAQYDPAGIRVPTLLILGEWDADTPPYMAHALFPRLSSAPHKRLVMIGEGTHILFTEKNRRQLFREVQLFLDEPSVND